VAKFWKKIGVEKTWINDLEEVKSVEKCQCGKKRDKFPRKNITYLVVHQTAAAATHEADLHIQEMMNTAGYLANGLEGFDIHQLQLHHLHHHGHIHGQLPKAQALPSFHESTIFDYWADLCMDMHHLG
jgi:hypothetical protein